MFVIAFQRKVDNKYVSSSQLSRADRELVSDLEVKPKTPSTHGNSKAGCWSHIGFLHSISRRVMIDAMRYYCKPCLEHEKKAGKDGHISKVVNFATSTSSGTMALHLSVKHNIGYLDIYRSTISLRLVVPPHPCHHTSSIVI